MSNEKHYEIQQHASSERAEAQIEEERWCKLAPQESEVK